MNNKQFETVGRRTRVSILDGKKVRKHIDGTDDFNDYWTDSAETSDSLESVSNEGDVNYENDERGLLERPLITHTSSYAYSASNSHSLYYERAGRLNGKVSKKHRKTFSTTSVQTSPHKKPYLDGSNSRLVLKKSKRGKRTKLRRSFSERTSIERSFDTSLYSTTRETPQRPSPRKRLTFHVTQEDFKNHSSLQDETFSNKSAHNSEMPLKLNTPRALESISEPRLQSSRYVEDRDKHQRSREKKLSSKKVIRPPNLLRTVHETEDVEMQSLLQDEIFSNKTFDNCGIHLKLNTPRALESISEPRLQSSRYVEDRDKHQRSREKKLSSKKKIRPPELLRTVHETEDVEMQSLLQDEIFYKKTIDNSGKHLKLNTPKALESISEPRLQSSKYVEDRDKHQSSRKKKLSSRKVNRSPELLQTGHETEDVEMHSLLQDETFSNKCIENSGISLGLDNPRVNESISKPRLHSRHFENRHGIQHSRRNKLNSKEMNSSPELLRSVQPKQSNEQMVQNVDFMGLVSSDLTKGEAAGIPPGEWLPSIYGNKKGISRRNETFSKNVSKGDTEIPPGERFLSVSGNKKGIPRRNEAVTKNVSNEDTGILSEELLPSVSGNKSISRYNETVSKNVSNEYTEIPPGERLLSVSGNKKGIPRRNEAVTKYVSKETGILSEEWLPSVSGNKSISKHNETVSKNFSKERLLSVSGNKKGISRRNEAVTKIVSEEDTDILSEEWLPSVPENDGISRLIETVSKNVSKERLLSVSGNKKSISRRNEAVTKNVSEEDTDILSEEWLPSVSENDGISRLNETVAKNVSIATGSAEKGLRRSERKRFPPLAHWRNEHRCFRVGPNGEIVDGGIEPGSKEDLVMFHRIRRQMERGQKKVGVGHNTTTRSSLSKDYDKEPFVLEDSVTGEQVEVSIHIPFKQQVWTIPPSLNNTKPTYKVCHCLSTEEVSFGYIEIEVNGNKEQQYSPNSSIHFVILQGEVVFLIKGNLYKLRKNDSFTVPLETPYSVENCGKTKALLHFCSTSLSLF